MRDVNRGDRTEKVVVLADLAREYQRDIVELREQLFRLGLFLGRQFRPGIFLVDLCRFVALLQSRCA